MSLLTCILGFALAGSPDTALPEAVQKSLDTENRKSAAQVLDTALARSPAETELGWLLLYRAEVDRLNSNPSAARAGFEALIADHPAHPARSAAALGIAVIDSNQNQMSGNSRATLEGTAAGVAPATLDAERYLLLARLASTEGDVGALEKYAKKSRAYATGDDGTQRRVERVLDSLNAPPVRGGGAAEPGGTNTTDSEAAALLTVRAALARGDRSATLSAVSTFKERYPASASLREVEYAGRRASSSVATVRENVLVLLPLSGTYAPAGRTVRAALEAGAAGTDLHLEFVDTAGDPTKCVPLLEKMVIDSGYASVIGPLLKEEAQQCAPAAQTLRVPMLTLTSWEEALATGDQIFRPTPTTSEQITALLAETLRLRGLLRYAVLYPQNSYGENAAKAFEAQVVAAGGSIAASLSYDPEAKDFRSVGKVLGKKDTKTRGAELARLRAGSDDPGKVTLPPLIDYEAIFIPDRYKQVSLLSSALAFEEFPVGSFKPYRDAVPLPLLGLSGWNNDELVRRGGKYVQNSIFVDAFDPRSAAGASDFAARFEASTGAPPTTLEAVAYDTVRVLDRAVDLQGELSLALIAAELADPVSGMTGFAADRAAERTWRVLTVTPDGIVPISAAVTAPE